MTPNNELKEAKKIANAIGLICDCDWCMGPNPLGSVLAIKRLMEKDDPRVNNGNGYWK